MEGSHSGLVRVVGNDVWSNPPGVRISYPPQFIKNPIPKISLVVSLRILVQKGLLFVFNRFALEQTGSILKYMEKEKIITTVLRFVMGFIFLWGFFDKVFGLGFSTTTEQAWINGGSPTYSFLTYAVTGPFINIFHSLAGLVFVDWLFMLGLLFVGLTLIFNKFIKWGCLAGCLMFLLMYLSLLLPESNPIISEHIVYILVLMLIAFKGEKEIT